MIYIMSKYTSYTQKEIGTFIGINKSNTIGQRLKRIKFKISKNPELKKFINEIEKKL